MAIPDYQTLMLPVLQLASDKEEHRFRDSVESLAAKFSLSDEEKNELLPSGNQAVFNNRVGWARSYLKQAGLLISPKRGHFKITEQGLKLLSENHAKISVSLLEGYPEFQEFRNRKKDPSKSNYENPAIEIIASETPEDSLASAYRTLSKNLEDEILISVKDSSPSFFERLVVDLLVKMGYGGNRQDAGRALGKSGDGGIDGIINEDRLGLDVIYIQAKRWEGTVGRPEIQKFAGALQGQRARKGVFITTSNFSKEALEYASMIESKIILIGGERLAALMAEHNVGVSIVGQYEVKKIDSDYFDEE
ncbi:MAG: restriction endonuclease [Gammaproteobacteria bacterium]|nr:restriction endonuclease [Gammaproteobacteria bacterium]MBU1979966.1 restriction endonuclease [Gammaproteobacteria bacterium]